MSMVCPQCNQTYEQEERICPTCNVQLLFFARIQSPATQHHEDDDVGQWQQTPWGRIIIGLVLAQGTAIGLKQLLTAGLLVSVEGGTQAVWATLPGLALLHSLHAIGLLAGGALCGAGQERGTMYGALVGLLNGLIFAVLQPPVRLDTVPESVLYAQPVLHLLVGAIGGWIGSTIWRPTPHLTLPNTRLSLPPPPTFEMRWLQGPIHWIRVIAGALLVACGVMWSTLILNRLVDFSGGAWTVETHFQARLLSWEIAGLTIVLGALFAGATTGNGAKQGLCVGIGGTVLFIGFQMADPRVNLETAVFTVLCMIGLGLAGGWFGTQLFPPLEARPRKRIVDL
jgi:hypothetical protein